MKPGAIAADAIACASLFAAIYAGLVASAAFGMTPASISPQPRMTLAPGDAECFARVVIDNRAGVYNATETLATIGGPVAIAYRTIGHHGPGADDRIEVVSLPPGVAAVPMEASVADGATLTVCLLEWIGG